MRVFKITSLILHPIFMPIITLYLTLKLIPNIGAGIINYFNLIYLIILLCTIILPLICVFFLIKKKLVSSLEMRDYKERSLPLFITAIWMGYGYYKLSDILSLAPILKSELVAAISIVLIASFISRYWKISLHMLGSGGVVGTIFSLNILYGGLLYEIMLSIFFSAFLGVARINENAHNHTQVYMGFLVGFLIESVAILFFQNYINNFNLTLQHSFNAIY